MTLQEEKIQDRRIRGTPESSNQEAINKRHETRQFTGLDYSSRLRLTHSSPHFGAH
jgi:hypothetical protein